MKRLYVIPTALGIFTFAAAAQDEQAVVLEKRMAELKQTAAQVRVVGLQGGIMGKTVKGAPYSGVEVNESTQMLADGTRIHNETQTTVYRDSEGRTRRETPDQITIMDPVSGTTYFLDPKSMTAHKAMLSTAGSYSFK